MRRRFRHRNVNYNYKSKCFKPIGVQRKKLNEISISTEELEVLRLRYLEKLDQRESAKKMGISQSQYQRDIVAVLEKLTKALIEGYAIQIEEK